MIHSLWREEPPYITAFATGEITRESKRFLKRSTFYPRDVFWINIGFFFWILKKYIYIDLFMWLFQWVSRIYRIELIKCQVWNRIYLLKVWVVALLNGVFFNKKRRVNLRIFQSNSINVFPVFWSTGHGSYWILWQQDIDVGLPWVNRFKIHFQLKFN